MRISSLVSRLSLAALIAVPLAGTPTQQAKAETFTGSYLSALHARAERDVKAAAKHFGRAVAKRPNDRRLLSQALFYAIAAGEMRRATALADRLGELEPQDRVSTLVGTANSINDGDFDTADARLETPRRGPIDALLIPIVQGWIALGQSDSERAMEAFLEPDANPLQVFFSRYHAGLAASFLGDHTAAVEHLQTATEMEDFQSKRANLAYAQALERTGAFDEALAAYDELLTDYPSDAQIVTDRARATRRDTTAEVPLLAASPAEGAAEMMFGLSGALARERDGRQFALLYARLALHMHPGFSEARLLVASLLDRMEQYEEAASVYADVPEGDASYVSAQVGRALAFESMERHDDAISVLDQLTEGDDRRPSVYFAKGGLLSRAERYSDCVAAFDDGVVRLSSIQPEHWRFFYGRGMCLERVGRWSEAEENFRQALELNPDQPDVLNYLGYSMVEMNDRLPEARNMIERAVEVAPDRGYIIDSLGWVLYRLGEYDEAVEKLQLAVEKEPVEPVINDHLGDALWKVGRKMEARFQWKRALSFDPEEEDRVRILKKLDVGLDAVLADETSGAGGAIKSEATAKPTDG
ncbi:MAG: tetratricopeptide repeat protein [Pseudomonadota bacterium]